MAELPFTGERYVPGLDEPDISYEHWHRYLFAAECAADKQVLDIACGEGYGSWVLAEVAARVIGVDIDNEIIRFAASKYQRSNLEFRSGPAHAIPVGETGVFDLIVSFETLEHMTEEHQLRFLSETKRLLKPDGILLLSTPNKLLYTDEPNYSNPFHVKELYREEFHELLARFFRCVKGFGQMVYPVSYLWPIGDRVATVSEHQLVFSRGRFTPVKGDEKQPQYVLAVCSDVEHPLTRGSFLIDLSHRMTAKLHEEISERNGAIEHFKGTLDERTAALDLRVRDAEALAHRITELETGASQAASHGLALERDLAARDDSIQQLKARIESEEERLLSANGEVVTLEAHVKQLEIELADRNARVAELQRAVDDNRIALAHVHETSDATRETIATLQLRVDALSRENDELRGAKFQSEFEVRRLQTVVDERTGLIDRLEKAASSQEDLLRQLQCDLADRATWAFRAVDALTAQLTRRPEVNVPTPLTDPSSIAQLTLGPAIGRQPADDVPQPDSNSPSLHAHPALHELEHVSEPTISAHPTAHVGSADGDLELVRKALEAEQTERQRLERVVNEGYKQLKRRVVETVDRLVPTRATVIVVSKGDDDLLQLQQQRRAWHFPQDETAVYAGHHPADSAAAITHLEQLRARGAQFLVFPTTSCWWLDHYSQFAQHLSGRYRRIFERDDVGVVFDLRRPRAIPPDWKTDLANLIEKFQARFRRNPAILDCETGLDVASSFPQHTVFSPPGGQSWLPYLDSTVDLVVCPAESPRAAEARRVAHTLLLTVTAGSNGARRPRTSPRLRAEWLVQSHARSIPSVSIVIPCHNGVRLTQSCLAAVQATLPSWFDGEIVVIDDASTDGTQTMLSQWAKRNARVRVLRNSKNIGFIGSCNRAANAARGDMLVLLNNDTQPAHGWLTALLRTFDEHPDAGAVGGKLIFPNGTLQEAGSLVFRDGSAANFGRGDRNPEHPLFNHVRQVDYCSGALLATPRRLFRELGRFETCYVPAYYEDADYCFKLRAKGYRVYYQPAAKVIHHEGASCGTDPMQGVKRHQTLNREKFRERWREALAGQPERPQQENFEAWQRLAVRAS